MNRQLLQGEGWRLGWNPSAVQYPALVGGEDWAMELTKEEFADLCSFLEQLSATMQQMSEHLMPEEGISCEMESERLWMEAEGFPDRFTLRFIVRQGRACEGNWRKEVLPPLRSAVRQIQLARVSQFSNS